MRKNPSLVRFLQLWMQGPIPTEILSAGADIMEMDDYCPERRVHNIVQKFIILWMENDTKEASHDAR